MTNDAFKAALEVRIRDLFRQKQKEAPTPESRLMIQRMQRLVLRAGKRSRPQLLQLTYNGYAGKDTGTLIDVALALELHHQFLLVHDDIMDNDTVRYDGPNILGYYRKDFPPEHTEIANSMALMAGNLLFTFACQVILANPDLTAEQKVALLAIIQETNVMVHAGQQLDIVNILALEPEVSVEKLLQTDFLKTAVYSVRQPMQVAAQLLKLDATEKDKIDAFGHSFGILYQLVDDYSDYFENDSSFNNHPKYRDYKQGKITYPLLVALKHAETKDALYLRQHAATKDISDETMQHVVEILIKCGAQDEAQLQIQEYRKKSERILNQLSINDASRQSFLSMMKSTAI